MISSTFSPETRGRRTPSAGSTTCSPPCEASRRRAGRTAGNSQLFHLVNETSYGCIFREFTIYSSQYDTHPRLCPAEVHPRRPSLRTVPRCCRRRWSRGGCRRRRARTTASPPRGRLRRRSQRRTESGRRQTLENCHSFKANCTKWYDDGYEDS